MKSGNASVYTPSRIEVNTRPDLDRGLAAIL